MYECIYVYICVYMCIYVYIHCIYVYIHCIYVYICVYMCIYVYTCVCVTIFHLPDIPIQTPYKSICMSVYMCIYVYICVYVLPFFVSRISRSKLLVHGGSNGRLGPFPLTESAVTSYFSDDRRCTHLKTTDADRHTG